MTLDITTTCEPGYDLPAMQAITLEGSSEDGQVICKLKALRWAEPGFTIEDTAQLVDAFDHYSGFAYGLAKDVHQRRRSLAARYGPFLNFACGFVGIITIETSPEVRGNRYGLELLHHLKALHAGMPWYAGLQAAPYHLEPETREYIALRKRLIGYYGSDRTLGFQQDSPRGSPSLMTAFWDCE